MKTYTLTWSRLHTWRKNGICRERFERGSFHWSAAHSNLTSPIAAFVAILTWQPYVGEIFGDHSYRLSSCGRLVARQATYQGV